MPTTVATVNPDGTVCLRATPREDYFESVGLALRAACHLYADASLVCRDGTVVGANRAVLARHPLLRLCLEREDDAVLLLPDVDAEDLREALDWFYGLPTGRADVARQVFGETGQEDSKTGEDLWDVLLTRDPGTGHFSCPFCPLSVRDEDAARRHLGRHGLEARDDEGFSGDRPPSTDSSSSSSTLSDAPVRKKVQRRRHRRGTNVVAAASSDVPDSVPAGDPPRPARVLAPHLKKQKRLTTNLLNALASGAFKRGRLEAWRPKKWRLVPRSGHVYIFTGRPEHLDEVAAADFRAWRPEKSSLQASKETYLYSRSRGGTSKNAVIKKTVYFYTASSVFVVFYDPADENGGTARARSNGQRETNAESKTLDSSPKRPSTNSDSTCEEHLPCILEPTIENHTNLQVFHLIKSMSNTENVKSLNLKIWTPKCCWTAKSGLTYAFFGNELDIEGIVESDSRSWKPAGIHRTKSLRRNYYFSEDMLDSTPENHFLEKFESLRKRVVFIRATSVYVVSYFDGRSMDNSNNIEEEGPIDEISANEVNISEDKRVLELDDDSFKAESLTENQKLDSSLIIKILDYFDESPRSSRLSIKRWSITSSSEESREPSWHSGRRRTRSISSSDESRSSPDSSVRKWRYSSSNESRTTSKSSKRRWRYSSSSKESQSSSKLSKRKWRYSSSSNESRSSSIPSKRKGRYSSSSNESRSSSIPSKRKGRYSSSSNESRSSSIPSKRKGRYSPSSNESRSSSKLYKRKRKYSSSSNESGSSSRLSERRWKYTSSSNKASTRISSSLSPEIKSRCYSSSTDEDQREQSPLRKKAQKTTSNFKCFVCHREFTTNSSYVCHLALHHFRKKVLGLQEKLCTDHSCQSLPSSVSATVTHLAMTHKALRYCMSDAEYESINSKIVSCRFCQKTLSKNNFKNHICLKMSIEQESSTKTVTSDSSIDSS